MSFQKGVIVKNVPITLCNFRYFSTSCPTQNYTVFEQKISFYNIPSAGPPFPTNTVVTLPARHADIFALLSNKKRTQQIAVCVFRHSIQIRFTGRSPR